MEEICKDNNISHIYIINMKKRVDRLLLMDFKLKEINIKYDIIEGVDGSISENKELYKKYLDTYNIYKNTNTKNNIVYNKYPINSCGAYGLLLTYKKLCELIPEDNNSNILIFEDDIVFHKDFFNEFQKKNSYIETNDILFLGANQSKFDNNMVSQINNNIGYYTVSNKEYYWNYGTYGMLLKPIIINKIRERLSDMLSPTLLNIDILIWNIICNNNLKGSVLYPNLVIPQLEESDNMGHRNINEVAEYKKWNLCDYKYLDVTSKFKYIYDEVVNNRMSLRKTEIQLYNDISNADVSKIIENGNKSFVFIIPSFNNSAYYKKNLDSVFMQKYPFWRLIYIDDASTDDTYNLVSKYIVEKKFQNKSTLIKNKKNMKQTYSRFIGYNMCQEDEICCMLDGDDWLYDENVLTKLNESYKSMNLLISYGKFYYYFENKIQNLSGFKSYTNEEIKNNNYRNKWVSQHLRTCQASLLQTIPKSYLKPNNEWLKCCSDLAEMWWVLELSEGRHANVNYPTYVYNKDASLTYENSFYNIDKSKTWETYRNYVTHYLKNYKHVVK